MTSRILNQAPDFFDVIEERGKDVPVFVHADIDDSGLDVYERAVYLTMARRAGRSGIMFESVANMATRLGIGTTKAREALRALESYGLIARREREGATSAYALRPRSHWKLPESRVPAAPRNHDGDASSREPQRQALGGATPGVAEVKPNQVPRAEKPNGFSALRGQAQAARKDGPGRFSSGRLFASEPAKPRKLSPNQLFIGKAAEAWNELRHPSWPECNPKNPGTRAIKYLQALFASEGKDPERAEETVRLGLRWIRSKDEWAKGQVFSFEQMLANEKLEAAASKARHHLAMGAMTQNGRSSPSAPNRGDEPVVVGGSYCRKGSADVVKVIEDVLGNGQLFLVEDQATGEAVKLSYHELYPIYARAASA